jgi:Zn ribbon nucleic-acid-binding protein
MGRGLLRCIKCGKLRAKKVPTRKPVQDTDIFICGSCGHQQTFQEISDAIKDALKKDYERRGLKPPTFL